MTGEGGEPGWSAVMATSLQCCRELNRKCCGQINNPAPGKSLYSLAAGGCPRWGGIENGAGPRSERAVRTEMIFQKLGHKGRREGKGRSQNEWDPELGRGMWFGAFRRPHRGQDARDGTPRTRGNNVSGAADRRGGEMDAGAAKC